MLERVSDAPGFHQFFENIALEGLPGPSGDVVSLIQNSPDIFRAGLILWLRNKMSNAAMDGDMRTLDRYQDLFICLAQHECRQITKIAAANDGETTTAQPASGKSGKGKFKIAEVFHASSSVSDGPKEDLTVFLLGNPEFPVTVIFRPAPTNQCAANNINCTTVTQTFDTPQDPLIVKEALWCSGMERDFFFDYEVILRDAASQETAPVAAAFNCYAHN